MNLKFLAVAGAILLSLPSFAAPPASPSDVQASMEQMAAAQRKLMLAMMLEKQSKLGFDETVSALQRNALARGWKIAGIMDVQDAMRKSGHKEAKPMKIIGMCPQPFVEGVLKAEQAANLPPSGINCRYSVYEGLDGKVYVMRFNTMLFAQMAQGDVAAALSSLSREEDAVLAGVLR
jgi:uncharacterized protein (DUF302 family)